jgi:hypothetical protein
MKATCGVVVWLALAGSQGCGGGSKNPADEFADIYCTEVAPCCARAVLPTDGQTCHQRLASLAQGNLYNAQAGRACLADVRAQASAGTLCAALVQSSLPPACASVYGTTSSGKQPGESCSAASNCAASSEGEVACVSLPSSQDLAKCQVRVAGKAGDTPCVGTRDGADIIPYLDNDATEIPARAFVCNIADGLRCRFGTCTKMVAADGHCSLSWDCVPSAFCDPSTSTCKPRVASGGKCVTSDPVECMDGYYCGASAGQCTAKVANGGSCNASSMCGSGYCLNQVCAEDWTGLEPLCGR